MLKFQINLIKGTVRLDYTDNRSCNIIILTAMEMVYKVLENLSAQRTRRRRRSSSNADDGVCTY